MPDSPLSAHYDWLSAVESASAQVSYAQKSVSNALDQLNPLTDFIERQQAVKARQALQTASRALSSLGGIFSAR